MDGRGESSDLNQVLWPDAEQEHLEAGHESVVLRLRESTGNVRTIVCEGHLDYLELRPIYQRDDESTSPLDPRCEGCDWGDP